MTEVRDSVLDVSVVVPVRNDRGGYLKALIAALEQQTLPRDRFEIVIGADGSTDGSTDGLETGDGHVRVVHGPPRNSYAARNMAARAARPSRVLAFVDSDCVPDPDWLEQGIAALADADAAAGHITFSLPDERTVWTFIDVETTKDHESEVKIGNAETANLFVRRDFFEAIGGFDDTIPEHGDFEFARRTVQRSGRLIYAPQARCLHPARSSGRSYLKMVWIMHRWYAAREVRAGRRPLGLTLRWWFPLVAHLKWRRDAGRSLRLDRRRLGANGLRPRLWDDVRALPLMYVVLPYFAGAAQVRGFFDGRRLR
jgi:GT2 family glycosyltransferase